MHNVQWRPVSEAEMPALGAIQEKLNARLGEDLELPRLDQHGAPRQPVLFAMAAEVDGKIIGAFYVEMVAEFKFCSVDPRFPALVRRDHWPAICAASKLQGLRFIQMPVPKNAPPEVGEAITHKGRAGLRESQCRFFIKDLE